MQILPRSLYTAAQVRELDRLAIGAGTPGIVLMKRAGSAVFDQVRSRWPACDRLLVFCGAGNNAGDGYIVAKLALERGYRVTVLSLVDDQRLRGDALTAYREYRQAGGECSAFQAQRLPESCVIVDALLGTGLDRTRPVGGAFEQAIAAINTSGSRVVAVDIPSGLHADSGQVLGRAVKADCTVTFIALKQGLFTGDAAEFCGDIVFDDLAVPADIAAQLQPNAHLVSKPRMPRRQRNAHKGHYGHVLLVGGDCGFSGAIRLAAEAALRAGAGLVSVATRAAHAQTLNCGRPEIMSHAVENAAQLAVLLQRANVVVIGPGLGQSTWARSMFAVVIEAALPCVIDADGLNLLAQSPQRRDDWIVTPHPGEAARLLQSTTRDIAADRFAAVCRLQQCYGGVALLKGAGSLIKDEHRLYVSTTGNPGMASGGMGDLLAGVIGALLAQGMEPSAATQLAAYAHGEAADAAVLGDGERGLLASDLLPWIRKLLNS